MFSRSLCLVLKKYFHIAFAADTPNGLVVPVVKNADQKSVFEIAQETSELAKKARDGKLGPADMQGACFTISSLGGIGGTYFAPIVNAPEVAILGVNKSAIKLGGGDCLLGADPGLVDADLEISPVRERSARDTTATGA